MVKKLITILFYFLFVAYILWEVYWYNQVGLTFIKWHTHLAFPFIVFLCLYFILKAVKVPKKAMNVLFGIYLIIQLFEIFAQITGIGKTPIEKMYGHFALSYKLNTKERYYWKDKPNTIKNLKTEEFHFTRKMNSEGYSDDEWKIEKDSSELRILCLGDSFTEGDGAHQDSSYVAFIRRKLQLVRENNVTIMNAGKCGSDPFFNYMNYRDQLLKYHPDIIIQTLSTNDLMSDIILRGGFERFEHNWGLAFDNHDEYNKTLFALSYVSRPFYYLMGYGLEAQKIKYPTAYQKDKMYLKVKDLFVKYSQLTKDQGARLIIVFQPQSDEVFENYDDLVIKLKMHLEKTNCTFDLREYYRQKTNEKTIYDYYWIKDGHHNAKGYNLMAEGIYEFLKNKSYFTN